MIPKIPKPAQAQGSTLLASRTRGSPIPNSLCPSEHGPYGAISSLAAAVPGLERIQGDGGSDQRSLLSQPASHHWRKALRDGSNQLRKVNTRAPPGEDAQDRGVKREEGLRSSGPRLPPAMEIPASGPWSPAAGPRSASTTTDSGHAGSCSAVLAPSCGNGGTEPGETLATLMGSSTSAGGGWQWGLRAVPPWARPHFQGSLFCLPIFVNLNKRLFQAPHRGSGGRRLLGDEDSATGRDMLAPECASPPPHTSLLTPLCKPPVSPSCPPLPSLTYHPTRIYSPSVCCEK